MTYLLKNLRTFTGTDGPGYVASLYLDSKKVGDAMNAANGAPDDLRFNSREDETAFQAFAAAWYETSDSKREWEHQTAEFGGADDPSIHFKMECWLSEAVDAAEEQKMLKRHSKKKTLFRVKGDPRGEWRTLARIGPEAVAQIRKQYGDQLEAVYGERPYA